MIVVVAPNPFKGSLGAPAAAAAIAAGVLDAIPEAILRVVPIADGGEGTLEALVAALSGSVEELTVEGPRGEPVRARWGIVDAGRTAVVELASACGLPLLENKRRDPRVTSTYGFGQLLEAARLRGVARVIAAIGGSATNDAGAGMAQALGVRLLDGEGRELARGGAALADLDRVDRSGLDPGWSRIQVEVAADVTNPLVGPTGASFVYGPQKGATPAAAAELDSALRRFAEVVDPALADLPGAGAAGGTAAGLITFLHASLKPGAGLVLDAVGLDRALDGADLVISGEGQVDGQSVYGKGPVEVARRARAQGVPTILLAGRLGPGWEAVLNEGVREVVPLPGGGMSPDEMMRRAPALLREAARTACQRL